MTEAESLRERLRRAEEALAFYGDPETYFAIAMFPDPPCGDFWDDFEELTGELAHPSGSTWTKPGKRARAYFKEAYPDGWNAEAEAMHGDGEEDDSS